MGSLCSLTRAPDLRRYRSLKCLLLFWAACIPAKVIGVVRRREEARVGELLGLAPLYVSSLLFIEGGFPVESASLIGALI